MNVPVELDARGPFYPVPCQGVGSARVAIILVNWNGAFFLERALISISEKTDHPYELVIVDNGSSDDSPQIIDHFKQGNDSVEIIDKRNRSNTYFSNAFNQGLSLVSPDVEYVVVFCNDVEVKGRSWLGNMVDFMEQSGASAAGQAYATRVSEIHRNVFQQNLPVYRQPGLAGEISSFMSGPGARYVHIAGYCFMLRKKDLYETGLYLQHGEFKQYHSDWELCIRLQLLGKRVLNFQPDVHHWHSISELIKFHPGLYADLLQRLADPDVLTRHLREGRDLYPGESGYSLANPGFLQHSKKRNAT
jgi:GT2 family glycosyltransferase